MDADAETAGRAAFQQDDRLPPQDRDQAVVEVDLLELGDQPVLLLAGLLLKLHEEREGWRKLVDGIVTRTCAYRPIGIRRCCPSPIRATSKASVR